MIRDGLISMAITPTRSFEMDVFDAHVTAGPSGIHGALALEMPELLAEMDRFGIRAALASHFAAQEYDAAAGNRTLAALQSERLVPAWALTPETLACVREHDARATRLSFGPERHNFSAAPWCSGELCEYLQAKQVLTLISREDLDWDALARLLENFPRLSVLFLDIGYRSDRYLFPLLRRFPGLYFETSTYLAHRQLESFVERHGADRALFGSRLPLYTPGAALAVLATARISDAARAAIAGGNLRRLLRRDAP
ncbi:MAG: amidohydrolase family protein [Terriglobia bacterium]